MNPITALNEQLENAHSLIDRCLEGMTPDQFHWLPPGTAHSVAATYAHTAVEEDWLLQHFLQGKATLAEGSWAGKTGMSALSPGGDWSGWARELRIEPAILQAYAHAVYGATDSYLATLKAEDLDRIMEMPFPGSPPQSLQYVLTQVLIGHVNNHIGEIAAIKGVQGLKGYPF